MEPADEGIRATDPGLTADWEVQMRKLIAGMKISVDGKVGWVLGLDDYTAIGLSVAQ